MYQHITLGTLKQRLQEKVGNSSIFWVPAEGRDAINEAICYWQGLTGEWTEVRSLSLTGQAIQDLPSQSASLFRVSYVSSVNSFGPGPTLPMTSLSELDNGFPGWDASTGVPSLWAPIGITKIAIYPQSTAGYLVLESYKEAPTLTFDTDFIDIGDEEIVRLLGYAQWYLSFKEGIKEGVENVAPIMNEMVQAAILRNRRLMKSSFYRDYNGLQREEFQREAETTTAEPGIRHV